MGISREGWGLRDGTPPNKKKHLPNKKKHHQARKTPFEQGKPPFKQQEKYFSSKGYLPIKCKSLQVVGVSGQGKAVVSDGG